jgi:hypothetical protein
MAGQTAMRASGPENRGTDPHARKYMQIAKPGIADPGKRFMVHLVTVRKLDR